MLQVGESGQLEVDRRRQAVSAETKPPFSFRLNPISLSFPRRVVCNSVDCVAQHLFQAWLKLRVLCLAPVKSIPFSLCVTLPSTLKTPVFLSTMPQWYFFQCSYWEIKTIFFKHCSFCIQQCPYILTLPRFSQYNHLSNLLWMLGVTPWSSGDLCSYLTWWHTNYGKTNKRGEGERRGRRREREGKRGGGREGGFPDFMV